MEIKFITGKGCLGKGLINAFLFIFGLLIIVLDPLTFVINKNLEMRDGSLVEKLWITVPVEMYNNIYVFNITNAEEFLSGKDSKIKFKELGPYVYKEVRGNVNITYHENGTFTYVPTLEVPFQEHLTLGDVFNDTLVTFNLPLLGVLSMMSDASAFKKFGLNMMINSFAPKPFITLSAHDFFWGYQDGMVSALSTLMPHWIDFDKFGILDRVYAYKRDEVTANLDEKKGVKYGIKYWNGSPGLKQWGFTDINSSLPCNSLVDTNEGLLFPPNFKPESKSFDVYKKMFCRPLKLVYTETVTDHTGLVGDSYTLADDALSCKNPDNVCYCPDDKPHLPEGTTDLSPCYYGLPFALSNPHFYQGDPALLEPFEGLEPDEKKHATAYIIQPGMGIPIKASAKFQLNIVMGDTRYNKLSKPFSNQLIPVVWIDSKLDQLPDWIMLLIRMAFLYLPVAQMILGWGFLMLGIGLFFYQTVTILKPNEDWIERQPMSPYPGRNPTIVPSDQRVINHADENGTLL